MNGMRWTRGALVAVGTAAVGYGTAGAVSAGLFGDRPWTDFLLASLLWPLLAAVPLVLVIGAVIVRVVPAGARPVLQAVLFATGIVLVVALPLLVGTGHDPAMPSALPRDYRRGLTLVLSALWAAATLALTVRVLRRRAAPPGT
ncbi:hypothetical protein ACIA8O_36425 [Kitasatospora sp. NPDC051853]|uniref:hypothetical protein n=1 Tax=Kitasatospora sp. NPDC051853 TaxID=3364058 RepID=UPI003788D701